MPNPKRSLYQCFHAKVLGDKIYCSEGYRLAGSSSNMNDLNINRLVRGTPLGLAICQKCKDYLEAGPPIPKSERGWL